MKNISNNSEKIIWNEATYVDIDGYSSKTIHIGTKYSEKEGEQLPTTIIKGAKITDAISPIDKVNYDKVTKQWEELPLFPSTPPIDKTCLGQIRLMLPIQIKETINEYIFNFKVDYIFDHPEDVDYE